MKNQIAIQMDNIETIDYEFDTSFLIAYEAQLRNYKIFYYNPDDLIIRNDNVQATGYYIKLNLDQNNYFKYTSDKIEVDLKNFNFVFLRQDPPFDMNYITSTYILDLLPDTTKVINNPTAVRNATEKLYTFNFREFMPPTIVTKNINEIHKFLDDFNEIITKPLYGNGGIGIHRFDKKNFNPNILEQYLDLPIMAQKYIREIEQGDSVLTFNEESGELEMGTVGFIDESVADTVVKITINEIFHDVPKQIITTPEHPFLVNGKWIEAQHIEISDTVKNI